MGDTAPRNDKSVVIPTTDGLAYHAGQTEDGGEPADERLDIVTIRIDESTHLHLDRTADAQLPVSME